VGTSKDQGEIEVADFFTQKQPARSVSRKGTFGGRVQGEMLLIKKRDRASGWLLGALLTGASFQKVSFTVRAAGQVLSAWTFMQVMVSSIKNADDYSNELAWLGYSRSEYRRRQADGSLGAPAIGDGSRMIRREDWNRFEARALLNRTGLA
jgi:hypothetical protein